ncbi:GNAT family N-acetyltransferase [Patescibacteria group bacterium]|nr:GNAT family N-acetyltransferase [Patescibacteria group bacterium]
MEIQVLNDSETAKRVGEFLTSPNAFEQTWAPDEKAIVMEAPLDSLGKENHRYWYIEDAGRIIGACGVRENKYGSGGYEMDSDYIAVNKNYRRKGLGIELLEAAESFVRERGGRYIHALSCDIDSYGPARKFYLNHGYKKVAEIPNYYVEGEGRIDYLKEFK